MKKLYLLSLLALASYGSMHAVTNIEDEATLPWHKQPTTEQEDPKPWLHKVIGTLSRSDLSKDEFLALPTKLGQSDVIEEVLQGKTEPTVEDVRHALEAAIVDSYIVYPDSEANELGKRAEALLEMVSSRLGKE